jgi:hypothetical protein
MQQAKWKVCGPPPESFYYSLEVRGTSCRMGRQVLTHARCLNAPYCSRHRYGPWLCVTRGSIAERTTACHRGERRIVAHASGD